MHTDHEIFEDLQLAEASAWLVQLQGPSRSAAVDAAFKAWLAEDVMHARAFARVTETWDIIPGAAQGDAPTARPVRLGRRLPMALAAGLLLALITGGFMLYALREPVYQTQVGEQRTVTLSDGSRITLNTDTKLRVAYSKAERRIVLDRGEALFDDVTNPRRPFIVQTGDTQVRALGTLFDVHRAPHLLEVTLVKGRVAIGPADLDKTDAPSGTATVLSPGERLTLRPGGRPTLDRPKLEAATAWERGEAMFDNATLAEVTAELNRYGDTHISLGDPALGQLRVSGIFSIRDPVEAARAIAKLCDLNVAQSNRNVVIKR